MKKVVEAFDSLDKHYLIPQDLLDEFQRDVDDVDMFDSGDFRLKWGTYRIMDFNQYNIYTDYLMHSVKSTVDKTYDGESYRIDQDYEKLFDDDTETIKNMDQHQKQIHWNKWKKFKLNKI